MSRELAVRAFGLYAPMALVASVWALRTVTRRETIVATLATIWTLIALVPVHVIAVQAGWWAFAPSRGTMLGIPIDLYLGWAILWGAWPALAFPRLPLAVVVGLLVALDLILMPLCEPVVHLRDGWWLLGEGLAVATVLVPAQLLARWTLHDRQLAGRTTLQALGFSTFMLWLLPAIIFEQSGETWRGPTAMSSVAANFALQALAIPAVFGLSAVCEFVQRGQGTPVPFDPPTRLVTTGPYAYVANPMQLAMALVFVGWGAVLQSWWVAAAGAMAVVYSVGLAAWDEGEDLRARFGADWMVYRGEVRAWRPRWRPFVAAAPDATAIATASGVTAAAPDASRASDAAGPVAATLLRHREPARLYVAASCGQCSTLGRWVAARQPLGLILVPAEAHPTRDLWRLTYDPGDGTREEQGIAALARALEHIHLGWALAGMAIRLPIVRPCLQAIVDASGGGPQRIRRDASAEGRGCAVRDGAADATVRGSSALPW